MAVTAKQRAAFWRLFSAACAEQGLAGREEREEYRHGVMMAEAGAAHLADVTRCKGFEAVMQRLAVDAGDWDAAAKYMAGDGRRMAWNIAVCANQVVALGGAADVDAGSAADYVAGILRQSGLARVEKAEGDWYMDVSEGALAKVFQMLDTHRRRLLSRCVYGGPKGFKGNARYVVADGVARLEEGAPQGPFKTR